MYHGLSPRARGNLQPKRSLPLNSRSIPACAGEPATPSAESAPAEVYPRVRGGTINHSSSFTSEYGLSPRARGNLQLANCLRRRSRSIPACAGEPPSNA